MHRGAVRRGVRTQDIFVQRVVIRGADGVGGDGPVHAVTRDRGDLSDPAVRPGGAHVAVGHLSRRVVEAVRPCGTKLGLQSVLRAVVPRWAREVFNHGGLGFSEMNDN